jgi:putative DNA primase/helicase
VKPSYNRIPEELRKLSNWVVWRTENRTDAKGNVRPTKVPYCAQNGRHAKTNDADTWSAFDTAVAAAANGRGYEGIGFVLTQTPYVGLDLDGCRDKDTGDIEPDAEKIINELASYSEVSPSGTGIRIIVRGMLPPGRRRKDFKDREHHGVEMYDATSPRYLTMTGAALNGNTVVLRTRRLARLHERLFPPPPPKPKPKPAKPPSGEANNAGAGLTALTDRDLIERAKQAKNGDKFGRLWDGDWSSYASQSEADLALCSLLAFWTDCDASRIDTLFRCSGLMREKWDAGRGDGTYGSGTIAEAIDGTTETYKPGKLAAAFNGGVGAAAGSTSAVDLLAPHFSDYGNSRRLIALYGEDLRYCHDFRKWLVWDGARWAVDDCEQSRHRAHQTVLEFGRQALAADNGPATKFAGTSLGSQRITNMLRDAQPDLAVRVDQLDTHPDLLNFNNGTLNLKTSELRPHCREDLLTKMVCYAYRPEARCPRFEKFLKQVTGKSPELIPYLQRALGYSLTGHTIEKVVLLLHGKGDNGKTTLLALFLGLLGEYAALLQMETLITRQGSYDANTLADLADLRGARFVMTSETEEGQRLSTGRLKRITQGMGRIKATRKYENPIEFRETHKLWIDANHLPAIQETDNAIWNRLHPVPFRVRFAKERQDPELSAKLKAEAEGILAWAVKGAADWYRAAGERKGLEPPATVKNAAGRWRNDSDQVGRFLDECCTLGEEDEATTSALYAAYKTWCDNSSERVLTATAFGKRMTERDGITRIVTKKSGRTQRLYRGVELRP